MLKIFNRDKRKQVLKIKEAMKKRRVCPLCRATGGFLSISSLMVFKEIFRVLEEKKTLKRMDLVRLVRAVGPAQAWVKNVLDQAIEMGWVIQDPKTKVIRLA
jgi:hypothetical protein